MIVVKRRSSINVVTMCAWRRPVYTWESIGAIASADGFDENYRILVHVDGEGHADLASMIRHMGIKQLSVVEEKCRIGCSQNTLNAITHGFENSDYVVHIEDDVVVSRDALKYFEWAKSLRSDPEISTVHAWRHCHGWYPGRSERNLSDGENGECGKLRFFQPWGWATWKDRWKELSAMWPSRDSTVMWDKKLNESGIVGVYPMISRALNIGWEGGLHGPGGGCSLPFWAGSDGFIPGRFKMSNSNIADYVHVEPTC